MSQINDFQVWIDLFDHPIHGGHSPFFVGKIRLKDDGFRHGVPPRNWQV